MKKEKQPVDWAQVNADLERQGKFDESTVPYNYDHTVAVDKDYVYLSKKLSDLLCSGFVRGLVYAFGPLVNACAFGLKIKGRKYLKAVRGKGAFSVSNHVHFLDNLVLRQGLRGRKKMFVTVAAFNSKSGLYGKLLRSSGTLPLPDDNLFSATRNLNQALSRLIKRKRVIHFYAEHTMWMYYPKPRPFKRGAFFYAAKFNTPVLPMFLCFTKPKGLRKLFGFKRDAVLQIMPPVLPDPQLPLRDRVTDLQVRSQLAFIRMYRQFYQIDKAQIYDIAPEYMDSLNQETALACKLSELTATDLSDAECIRLATEFLAPLPRETLSDAHPCATVAESSEQA